MKNKDKAFEIMDELNNEVLNESNIVDEDAIDIDSIENSIIDKMDKIIDDKINAIKPTESHEDNKETIIESNEEDSNDES